MHRLREEPVAAKPRFGGAFVFPLGALAAREDEARATMMAA
jgi:hypothetical protein